MHRRMTDPQSSEVDLAARTWTDLARTSGATLLVPVGSCEQHGPHLPLDTDTHIAVAVARAAAAEMDECVVAPAVGIGASGEHQSFPGTLSIGTDVLTAVLVELGRSALPPDGSGPFRTVVFVNGHGGNVAATGAAVSLLRSESRSVLAWSPRIPGGDAHAGRSETSIMLHLAADRVGAPRPRGNPAPLSQLADELRRGGVGAVSPNGVLGDAAAADAHEGGKLFSAMIDDLRSVVASASSTPT